MDSDTAAPTQQPQTPPPEQKQTESVPPAASPKRQIPVIPILIGLLVLSSLAASFFAWQYFSGSTAGDVSKLGIRLPGFRPTPSQNDHTTAGNQVTYPVVDTGQTHCFDTSGAIQCGSSFSGQDAQYAGLKPSYTDTNNGTVTDNVTGLMWVKNAGNKQSYANAVKGASSFALAGYHDWRVPTIKELYSLMNFTGVDPSSMTADPAPLTPFIDTAYFDFSYGDTTTGDRVIDSQWVTSDTYVSKVFRNQQCFFDVNFADGRIKCYPTADTGHNNGFFVRYVRGNAYGANNFHDNYDDTVTDEATGLTWQQDDSKKGMNWNSALSYCESLSLAGHDDWRLPNAKELQSIVDYSRSPDTTNSPALSPLFRSSSITNEAGQRDWPYYWTGTTHGSQTGVANAVYISFGRAMGYVQNLGGWIDVHGAGAQRSDPKTGSASDYPTGHGPQGDAIRILNYARCVRGGNDTPSSGGSPSTVNPQIGSTKPGGTEQPKSPPEGAVTACSGKTEHESCAFQAPKGTINGVCKTVSSDLVCVPDK